MSHTDAARDLLRHAVATIAYRGGKTLQDAPPAFATYRPVDGARTPAQIVAHMGDLFDWALSIAQGAQAWKDSAPRAWDDDVARFFDALGRFDEYLASDAPLHAETAKLLQGPVADALTHVGQLAMLRRLSSMPIRGENYFKAEIVIGRVGRDQARPRREF
jgi:hypothetical protein